MCRVLDYKCPSPLRSGLCHINLDFYLLLKTQEAMAACLPGHGELLRDKACPSGKELRHRSPSSLSPSLGHWTYGRAMPASHKATLNAPLKASGQIKAEFRGIGFLAPTPRFARSHPRSLFPPPVSKWLLRHFISLVLSKKTKPHPPPPPRVLVHLVQCGPFSPSSWELSTSAVSSQCREGPCEFFLTQIL